MSKTELYKHTNSEGTHPRKEHLEKRGGGASIQGWDSSLTGESTAVAHCMGEELASWPGPEMVHSQQAKTGISETMSKDDWQAKSPSGQPGAWDWWTRNCRQGLTSPNPPAGMPSNQHWHAHKCGPGLQAGNPPPACQQAAAGRQRTQVRTRIKNSFRSECHWVPHTPRWQLWI